MPKQVTPVWRVYRIQGRNALIVRAVKAPDETSAVKLVADDLGISDPKELDRFFARLDD
jgi:hypothetical protein